MGHVFSLVLSREITNDESLVLQEAGCAEGVFSTDSHPTNADVTVTKIDFDDTVSPSLADAIKSALEAVKKLPDVTVPELSAPGLPRETSKEDAPVVVGEVVEQDSSPAVETDAKA